MKDRAPNDWGSIPDWIQVFFVVFTPLFGVLLEVWLEWDSTWTIFLAAFLALISSLVLVVAFGRLRATPIGTFIQALQARILSDSLPGILNRVLLAVVAAAIVFFCLYRIGHQSQNWWIGIGVGIITWLGLGLASSNLLLREVQASSRDMVGQVQKDLDSSVRDLRSGYSSLQASLASIGSKSTYLEARLLGYPHGDFAGPWWCNFTLLLDISTEIKQMDGPDTHVETASCVGIERKAIFQHPPNDGKTDAVLRFASQPASGNGYLVLTFYTGIRDSRVSTDGTVERSGFVPNMGNKIQFDVYVNGVRIFRETRKTFEWRIHSLVLPPPPTEGYEVEFRTNALDNSRWNWAVWGEPRLGELGLVFEDMARITALLQSYVERSS